MHEVYQVEAPQFDARVKGAVSTSAAKFGYETMEIVSGAGHDACNIAKIAPTALVFIPCENGLSHNEV